MKITLFGIKWLLTFDTLLEDFLVFELEPKKVFFSSGFATLIGRYLPSLFLSWSTSVFNSRAQMMLISSTMEFSPARIRYTSSTMTAVSTPDKTFLKTGRGMKEMMTQWLQGGLIYGKLLCLLILLIPTCLGYFEGLDRSTYLTKFIKRKKIFLKDKIIFFNFLQRTYQS